MISDVSGATFAASGRGFDIVETEEGDSGGWGTDPASLASVRLEVGSQLSFSPLLRVDSHGLFVIWFARGIL